MSKLTKVFYKGNFEFQTETVRPMKLKIHIKNNMEKFQEISVLAESRAIPKQKMLIHTSIQCYCCFFQEINLPKILGTSIRNSAFIFISS